MSLDQEIAHRRTEIHSDGYPMSIGELINLYRDGELDIHPEFQRFYRWSDEQKSRLIESILLGIPIPSIFVSQREDGVWDVIDGLQRLSTIFQLVGHLKDDNGEKLSPLALKRTKYLPSLEGKKWQDDDPEKSIGTANQLIIRRSKIDVKIILRESSESSKYELFQRLNTGGSQLSDQEIRNAILVMVNPDAYRWISELAQDNDFQTCVPLSDRALRERYDLELVTRFVVFRSLPEQYLSSVGDLREFLTDRIVDLAQSSDFEKSKATEEEAFRFTFSRLAGSLGEDSFRKYDPDRNRHLGGFLISAFEPVAMGLGYNYQSYADNPGVRMPDLRKVSRDLWSDNAFLEHSGSGVGLSSRIRANIPLGRRLLAPCQ